MLESLHVCGSILTTKDYHYFALYCSKCDGSFGQWSGFLKHFESKHGQVVFEKEYKSDDDQCAEFDVKRQIENELNKLEKSALEDDTIPLENDAAPPAEAESSDDEDRFSEIGQIAADNDDGSSSQEAFTSKNSNKLKLKTFNYNLHDTSTRKASLEFLKVIRKCPVLWDTKHPKHREVKVRTSTLEDIKDYFEKIGYSISDAVLRRTIPKILRDFKEAKQEVIVCGKASEKCAIILKECSFLDDAEKQQNNSTTRNLETNSDSNNTDVEESLMNFESDAQYESSSSETEISAPSAFYNDGREGKRIRFSVEDNPLTIEFINLVRDNEALWNTRQTHNNLERKRILESWIPIFEERHNVTFTYKDLSLNWNVLRSYCNKLNNRKYLSGAAQFVKEQCSFLPKPNNIVRLKCEHCERTFLMQHNYQAHLFSVHNIGENPFKCHVCSKDFSSYTQLDTHLKGVHMKQQTAFCEVCNRGFFRTHGLEAHMRIHTGEKQFICEICGQGFRRRVNLKNHEVRIHLRQRNFACELCPKTFYIKAHLRDHINAHLNIRNHKCPTCGKAFHSSHALMRHKQIHSDVKRYACKLCEARFHQFVGLNSHMKNKHRFVQDKEEEQTANLLNNVVVTSTEPPNIEIKGELMQSMESWNM